MNAVADRSLVRSSTVMALGTVASRLTGFAKVAVLAFALGTATLGDAYNTANNIPNVVYELLLGGILTSVVVPLLVRARKRDADGGEAYEQRLFTLAAAGLFVITAAAVVAAEPLISLYTRGFTEPQHDLAVTLARFFLPQIFFLGVTAMARATLNTRGHFAAPMWTPVLNNLVVIAVGAAFLVVTEGGASPGTIDTNETRLLGIGTTLGIVVQTLALIPALRSVGFRWRLRFDLARLDYRHIGSVAGWVVGYVLVNQAGFLIVTNLATAAGARARDTVAYGAGYTPYMYAFLLFSLPYAIVAVSVITALLPRMSGHAEEGHHHLVRDDFSNGLRLTAVLIVPGAVAMLALGPQIAVLLFAYFRTDVADAVYVGYVLAAFAVGLVGYSVYQLMLRVFYAFQDTRTPAFIAVLRVVVMGALDVAAFLWLPPGWIVVGMALAYSISYYVAAAVSGQVLRRRLGGIDARNVTATLTKLVAAAVPGGIFAYAMALGFTEILDVNAVTSLLSILLGVAVGGLLYVLIAVRLGVREVHTAIHMVRSRVGAG